jgi:hypothetical protein
MLSTLTRQQELEMMTTPRRKLKIYYDDAKLRQTSHWDLDYMTTGELEAFMSAGREAGSDSAATPGVVGTGGHLDRLWTRLARLLGRPSRASAPGESGPS